MKHLYVLLDNGHGVDTKGKRSPDESILEYKYTRDLATSIYTTLLECENIHPILVVPELQDVPLSERVNRINNYCKLYGAKNCILISLHLNAAGNGTKWMSGQGWEAYTTRKDNNSDRFCTYLYFYASNIFKNRKIRADYTDGDPDKEADWYIIKGANCPAVLTENFFMDNKSDVKYLLSEQGFNNIVKVHVEAIKKCQSTM
jgi:N-acetylmuramoyl-L-alanine amidase